MTVAPPKTLVTLRINGLDVQCSFHPNKTLLEVLREDVGLTGTKHGCEMGHCGMCTVLLDGRPELSCLVLGVEAVGRVITTVEGLAQGGKPHPVQQAFVECGAAQCGYCTPAFVLTSAALIAHNADPSLPEIKDALSGCLCRCTGYTKIYEAVQLAATRTRSGSL